MLDISFWQVIELPQEAIWLHDGPGWVARVGRGVGRQGGSPGWVARVGRGGSLDLSFSLYLVLGRASRPRPTWNRQADKQADKQTRLPSRTPFPIAPRDQNTPLGTPSL